MGDANERLKRAREKAGYSSGRQAALAMGVPPATYAQHESGERGIPADRAQRYAKFFRVTPEWLVYGTGKNEPFAALGPSLHLKGEVAAGVWKDAWEYEPDEWEFFTGRADVTVPMRERFGLRVAGDSMNEVYPPGSILECVAYDQETPIENGKRVIVQRRRFGTEYETTVKEFHRADDGVVWLVPRSSNPAFQTPFRPDQPEDGIDLVQIIGIVVASVRPE